MLVTPRSDPHNLTVAEDSRVSRDNAWQIGIDRYLATLPIEHKQALKIPVTAEDCLKLLQQVQCRNRKFDRLATFLQPLIEPLKRFEASIDVLVQTYSTVASPIWGPIRIIITVMSSRLSTLNNLVVLLERLVQPLKRFHNYELLFDQNVDLRHAIGALYGDLIEFCVRVVSHQTKSVLRKTFGSFDNDVAEMSEKIRHHWAEVDIAANAANLIEAKAARAKEDLQRVYDLQRDINRWLAPANVEDDSVKLQNLCLSGSCDWIWNTTEMTAFLECENHASIRLSGLPGGGKSVAAAWLVNRLQAHVRSNNTTAVLYFFCRATDADKSYATNAIRTLSWQLLQAEPALYNQIASIYNRSGRQIADSEVLVFEVFETIIRQFSGNSVYIVIDALDECHDTSTLINILLTAQRSKASAQIKLIFTSRDDPDLWQQLSFCTTEVLLQSNTEPLTDYIKDRVQKLKLPIPATEQRSIVSGIVTASDGLWLFAKLMLDELDKALSLGEIRQQMQTVPAGLAQLYHTIISKREKAFTKSQLQTAQQIYLWLDPLDYVGEELWKTRNVQGINDEVIDMIMKYATQSETELFNPMDLVLKLCSPLVTTRFLHANHIVTFIDGQPLQCSAFVVDFFHQTAKQYLKWSCDAIPTELPLCIKPRRLAALQRAVCAAWYFGQSQQFQDTLQHLRERPRSEYDDCWIEMASALWQGLHVDRLKRNLDEDEVAEAEELCDKIASFFSSDRCLTFVETSLILHYSGQCSLLSENALACPLDQTPLSRMYSNRSEHLQRLIDTRSRFVGDLMWCLTRFVGSTTFLETQECQDLKPADFDKRPLARKMFALTRRYRWLLLDPGACSMNGFLLGSKP